MGKSVIVIPPTEKKCMVDTNVPGDEKKRRVAVYARVSTDHEEQQSSYEAQIAYYTDYIKRRKDWELAAVYSDEGITGCNTKKRDGFNRMVQDALSGSVDLIVTKSVSRFARNTVDSLITIRKLKEKNVECFFEKENIWTFDGRGELLLTIMSSLAQEESRSISQNCTWGQRKRFADGKATVPFGRFLGYDRGSDGNLVINEEQAAVVRRIYGLFLQGHSPHGIAKLLTAEGIPTPGGMDVWPSSTVKSILTNEKYKGDALLQKVYTVDFLTKRKKVNQGEVAQYYVEGSHPAIIAPVLFDEVQSRMALQYHVKGRRSCGSIFSGRIKCGDCGGWYGPKVWHSGSRYQKSVWQCNHRFDGERKCSSPYLEEDTIKVCFLKAVHTIFQEMENLMEDCSIIKDRLYCMRTCIRGKVGADECPVGAKKETGHTELGKVQGQAGWTEIERFISKLEKQKHLPADFNQDDWYSLVEYVTVYSREDIGFTFKNGREVRT